MMPDRFALVTVGTEQLGSGPGNLLLRRWGFIVN